MMKIAVLALQGAFAEHERMLGKLGVPFLELRQKRDLNGSFDGLILPGGESTVQGKLLHELGMFDPLKKQIAEGLPVFGTCAGLLLLAGKIANDDRTWFGTMDITAVRNAYGRQLGSFYTESECAGAGRIPMTFIRAPYILSVSQGVCVLARAGGKIVAARQGNQLVAAFHPELNENTAMHEYFLAMVRKSAERDRAEVP